MDPTRKQSFVRGDSTRKALHRRTPSAPNTPRLDHERQAGGGGAVNGQHKASSQPRLDSLPSSPASDSSSLLTSPVDTSLGIDIDAAIKARLQQMALQCRGGGGARSSDSGSPRSPEKLAGGGGEGGVSPPSWEGEGERRTGLGMGNGVVELQASPGAHRRHDPASPLEPARFFVSRYHDYAEILSDEEGGGGGGPREASSAPSSATDMQELVEKLDSKLSSASRFYRRDAAAEESSEPEAKHAKLDPEKEKAPHVPKQRSVERVPAAAAGGRGESPPSTQVVRRRAEWIPASESARTAEGAGAVAADFPELPPRLLGSRDAALPPIPQHRTRLPPTAAHPHLHLARPGLALPPPQGGAMSKCLSVPSDIARSLEDITASQSDLLSSVTLSELSQSINSFCTGAPEEEGERDDRFRPPSSAAAAASAAAAPRESPRWRRSASLDSLEADSALCRSLRAINAQMDSAFHQKVELAIQLEEEGYSRHGGEDMASLTPLHISEDNLASPTTTTTTTTTTTAAVHETHFPATPDTPTAGEAPRGSATAQPGAREAVPRSVSESGELGGREGVSSAAMSQSYPATTATTAADQYADYAVVTKRQSASRSAEVGVGGGFSAAQRDFPDYAFIPRRQAVCIGDSDFGPQHGNFADWESFSEDQYTAMLSRAAAAALTPVPAPAPAPVPAPAPDQNSQRTSALGNAHTDTDSAVWSRAGEAVAEASQTLSHIARPRSPGETSRAAADSRLGDRLSARSDASTTTPPSSSSSSSDPGGTLRSHASTTRSDASSLPRTDPSRERPALSEVSAGVCVVKRQRHSSSSSSSSSGSTSSSDAGDVSDDSIEIVHQARPADAQFAMKLRGKERAAESLPARSSPTLLPDPPCADVVPGDLRQFSPDDVMWRQSPLFGRSGEFGEEFGGPEGRSPFSHSPRAERDRLEAPGGTARRTETYGAAAGGGTFRTLVHPAEEAGGDCPPYHRQAPASPDSQRGSRMAQSYEGRLRGYSLPSEHKPDTSTTSSPSPSPSHSSSASSPRPEARRQVERRARRASSQSDSALKRLAHEDVPILARNLLLQQQQQQGPAERLASTPAAQRSHIPSPRSPTLTSPTPAPAAAQHTRLTSPRSPIISASPAASSHHHPHSRIPSPRSPTSASQPPASPSSPAAAGGGNEAAPPSVPLHLMLYHPDEFQVPPAAVGMAAGSSSSSSSLPQVHVKSDTVTEEKAVIRKGSSSRAVTEPGSGQGQGWGPSGELAQPVWRHALPTELQVQRGESLSRCLVPGHNFPFSCFFLHSGWRRRKVSLSYCVVPGHNFP